LHNTIPNQFLVSSQNLATVTETIIQVGFYRVRFF